MWNNLRLFSGWMFAGNLAGMVSFSIRLGLKAYANFDLFDSSITQRSILELKSSSRRHSAAFNIFYPVHVLCVICAINTLLRRVSDHASHPYYNTVRDLKRCENDGIRHFDLRDCIGQYALFYWVRSMHIISILLSSVNILVRIVAAAFDAEAAGFFEQAASSTDLHGGRTKQSSEFTTKANSCLDKSEKSIAVSRIIEATIFFFVLSGFMLFFPAIIVMFGRIKQKMNDLIQEMCLRTDVGNAFLPFEFLPRTADGSATQTEMPITVVRQFMRDIKKSAAKQRRRFVFCLVLMTAALMTLASFSVFITLVYFDTTPNPDPDCGDCQPSCQSVGYLMYSWQIFTPELFPLVASLSSTLPLVFSLWLMTTPKDRELLMHPIRFLSTEMDFEMNPLEISRDERLRAERIRLGIELD